MAKIRLATEPEPEAATRPKSLQGESYWDLVFRQYRRNRIAVFSLVFVVFLFLIAIAAPFLAHNRPIAPRGSFRTLYQDRFEEWKLGGHPELVAFLRNLQATSDPDSAAQLAARLGTVRRQIDFLAMQLPGDEAARLRGYLREYEQTVASASAGDRPQLSAQIEKLESNSQEISRQFDPAT